MRRSQTTWSVLIFDLIGGAIVLGCLAGSFWYVLLRNDDTAAELVTLTREIAETRRVLSEIRAEHDRERVVLKERSRELADSGALPDRAPVEQYFQQLSSIAERLGLEVMRQNPLPQRTYPGLLERRYAYEVSGMMPDIERFLVEIEETEFWADVGFLKISGMNRSGGDADARVASMTISVFSALAADSGSKKDG